MAFFHAARYLVLALLGWTVHPNSSPPTHERGIATSCGENEVHSECGARCQRNCTNWHKPTVCPHICEPGCVCKRGLVRDEREVCVSPHQCKENATCEGACNTLCFLQTVAMRGRCTSGKCECW